MKKQVFILVMFKHVFYSEILHGFTLFAYYLFAYFIDIIIDIDLKLYADKLCMNIVPICYQIFGKPTGISYPFSRCSYSGDNNTKNTHLTALTADIIHVSRNKDPKIAPRIIPVNTSITSLQKILSRPGWQDLFHFYFHTSLRST